MFFVFYNILVESNQPLASHEGVLIFWMFILMYPRMCECVGAWGMVRACVRTSVPLDVGMSTVQGGSVTCPFCERDGSWRKSPWCPYTCRLLALPHHRGCRSYRTGSNQRTSHPMGKRGRVARGRAVLPQAHRLVGRLKISSTPSRTRRSGESCPQ